MRKMTTGMRNMVYINTKSKYCLLFLIYFLLGIVVFLPFIIQDKGFFVITDDYNYQQIVFNVYCNRAIKQGNVLWDWNTDLGGSFIGNYAFYSVGSPFFWLMCLFPSELVPYAMGPLLGLKYGVAGFTAYLYLKRHIKGELLAAVGGVLYAFSGFQAANLLFHFQDAIAFFPLLLIGMEKLIDEKKKGQFALAVALNATTNYFFL